MKTFNQFINEHFKDKERRLYGNSPIYEIEIDYDYTHSGNLFGCFINVNKKNGGNSMLVYDNIEGILWSTFDKNFKDINTEKDIIQLYNDILGAIDGEFKTSSTDQCKKMLIEIKEQLTLEKFQELTNLKIKDLQKLKTQNPAVNMKMGLMIYTERDKNNIREIYK